jgi:conjugal transfer pilus assembly protein TraE
MKHLLKQSRIHYLVNHRNGYFILAMSSLLLNMLLSGAIYFILGYEKIVLVPPTISREFWVSTHQVSPEYLSSMSLFLADIRLNVTPANAALQRELFLRYVNPNQYEKLKCELMEQEAHLKKEHISMIFFITNVEVDAARLRVNLSGDLQYIVGDALQPAQHVTYQMAYRLHSGRLMLESLEEEKAHG